MLRKNSENINLDSKGIQCLDGTAGEAEMSRQINKLEGN